MDLTFSDLKYLVTVVSEDLLNDDFGNFQDGLACVPANKLDNEVSNEMYDKVHLLQALLSDLYKHRPIPF